MFKSKKQQSFSKEKIADLYLAELAKFHKQGTGPLLDAFLMKQNIYMDIEKIEGVLHLLGLNGLIEKAAGSLSIFSYSYAPGTDPASISGDATAIPQMRITDKGAHFVRGGQSLDEKGKTAQTEARKKSTDRWISAGISFGVAVGVMVIKSLFFDHK